MSDDLTPLADDRFMRNVKEARSCGFDLCCPYCGQGILDDSDAHDTFCPLNPEYAENQARAERWAEKQLEARKAKT